MTDMRAHDWIRHHARRRPKKAAIVDFESGVELSYREMDRQADACAAFLHRRHNIAPGDRVALLAQNCPEVFVIQAACARLRAILLPLNWRLAEPELDYMLSDATPKTVFADARFIATAEAICAKRDGCHAVEIGAGTEFDDILRGGEVVEGLPDPVHSDIWHILYTSGTTGRPKGAMLSHGQNYLQAVNLGAEYGVSHESIGLTYTPTFHASGLFMFANPSLLVGATTYLMRQFDSLACLKTLMDPEIGITHTLAIPTNLLMIRNLPEFKDAQFNGLVIASGGAPVASTLIETYGAHGAKIPQVWGMTELCGVSTSLPAEESLERTGSCGPPLMNMDISIVDPEDNHISTPDTVGEIVARGPMVMKGYWGLGDKNKDFFVDGEWFRTGDAGSLSADGYLTIVGRWKDMYISGGENVYPAEVEDVIYQMPAVDEVAVLGVPHEKWGETGRAYVVVKKGQSLTGEEVMA
jgi:fatty-acyl-CoA synthase